MKLKDRIAMRLCATIALLCTIWTTVVIVPPAAAAEAEGTVYYVDDTGGSDDNSGTSAGAAWQSLDKVNATTFAPGDKILFKSGGSWSGRLWPKGSGAEGSPIVIDQYGTGSKPLIAGVMSELEAVFLKNQQYWEINNLEVTNRSPLPFDRDWENPRGQRRGVYILNEEAGILRHVQIKNLTIHDVDGSYTTRSGGIIFDSVGSTTPSAFDGILIDGNTLTDVDAYGIYIGSNCILRYGMGDLWPWVPKPYGPWTPSTNVKISNNSVIRAATGGIAWNVTDGAIVERNTVQQATYLATNASIWWAYADNNLVQFNESFESVNGAEDGHGFDVDAGNIGSLVQYNYSHDNAGGFMLYVNDTYDTINTIVRYNISQNDKKSIFRYSGSIDNVYNYNNTVYVGESSGNPVMSDYFTKASGAPTNIKNYNNAYYSVGDQGWDLRGQSFDYNAYYGGNTFVQADAHKVVGDPKFAHPGSGGSGMNTVDGYQLQPDSPLIGAGIRIADNGERDYYGNPLYNGAPDIGAHEYAGSVPPAGQMPDPIVFVPLKPISTPAGNLAPQANVSTTFNTPSSDSGIQNLNDKYYDTVWLTDSSPALPGYITLDFGAEPVAANELKLNTRFGQGRGITNLDLEYDNGAGWVPLRSDIRLAWRSNSDKDEIQSVEFPLTRVSKLRIKVNEANRLSGPIGLNELELYNNPDLNKDLVSTTFPTGAGDIANIIDGNVNSSWGSASGITLPGYISLDYGNSPITVNKVTLVVHFGIGQGITNIDVEYFDGSRWITALSHAPVAWALNDSTRERQSVAVPAFTASRIRLKVNDANMAWGNIALAELILENIPDSVPAAGISLDRQALAFNSHSDRTATLTAAVLPVDATNKKVAWHSTDPSVATVDASGRVTATGEGRAAITATTEDGGFQASSQVMVDWSAPLITIGSIMTTTHNAGDFKPQIQVADALSGVDPTKTVVKLDGKALDATKAIPLYTLELGTHTLTVTAADLAGNEASQSVSFQVNASQAGLTRLVQRFASMGWIDNQGIANSLTSKLEKNNLQSFISEVKAQAGKHISADAASYLHRNADALLGKRS